MEKYGCDRIEEINLRIKEMERTSEKTANKQKELNELYKFKKELELESVF